jgi:hypothetical protein
MASSEHLWAHQNVLTQRLLKQSSCMKKHLFQNARFTEAKIVLTPFILSSILLLCSLLFSFLCFLLSFYFFRFILVIYFDLTSFWLSLLLLSFCEQLNNTVTTYNGFEFEQTPTVTNHKRLFSATQPATGFGINLRSLRKTEETNFTKITGHRIVNYTPSSCSTSYLSLCFSLFP